MKNLKPVVWTAVGMFVGAAGVLVASQTAPGMTVVRQDPVAAAVGQRLQVTKAGTSLFNDAYFVKDSKSGACWLALKWDSSHMNLAAAPKEACD